MILVQIHKVNCYRLAPNLPLICHFYTVLPNQALGSLKLKNIVLLKSFMNCKRHIKENNKMKLYSNVCIFNNISFLESLKSFSV